MLILKLIHKAIWWLLLATVAVVLKLFSFTLGWLFIAPTVWLGKDGNYPQPIREIFQPDDSLAIGDDPTVASTVFQDREGAFTKKYPEWIRNYVLAVMWSCMRNPAYGWDSNICGVPADIKIIFNNGLDISFKRGWNNIFKLGADIDWGYGANEEAIYTLGVQAILAETGHWAFRFAFTIPFTTRGFLVQLGWNLRGGVVNSKTRNLKIDIAGKSTVSNKI